MVLRDDEQGTAGGLSQLPQFLGGIGTAGLAAVVTARAEALAPTTSPAPVRFSPKTTTTLNCERPKES